GNAPARCRPRWSPRRWWCRCRRGGRSAVRAVKLPWDLSRQPEVVDRSLGISHDLLHGREIPLQHLGDEWLVIDELVSHQGGIEIVALARDPKNEVEGSVA